MHKVTLHKVFIVKERLLCTFGMADGSTFISGHVKQSLCSVFQQLSYPPHSQDKWDYLLLPVHFHFTQKIFSTAQSIIIHGESDLAYRLSACEEFERVNH